MSLNPYLGFAGNCEEAFNFYAKVLGAKIHAMIRVSETPMAEKSPADRKNKIVHARLEYDGALLMGGDAPPEYYKPMQGSSVIINMKTPEEAERVFKDLSEGGQITGPISETFWAKRFGTLTDRFGTAWMVNCEKPMP
jgi:PhnB protein